jgi:hypothetical protein
MDSLTELYNQQILPLDEELEKQASEMWKQAEEEDAAGRIMARGFADEMNKLSAPMFDTASPIKDMGKGTTIKVKQPVTGSDTQLPSRKGEGQAVAKRTAFKGPQTKGMPVAGQVARKAIGAKKNTLAAGPSAGSQGKQFKNMQAGGNAAPGAKPAVAAKPPAPKPVAAAGSVTGSATLGNKLMKPSFA